MWKVKGPRWVLKSIWNKTILHLHIYLCTINVIQFYFIYLYVSILDFLLYINNINVNVKKHIWYQDLFSNVFYNNFRKNKAITSTLLLQTYHLEQSNLSVVSLLICLYMHTQLNILILKHLDWFWQFVKLLSNESLAELRPARPTRDKIFKTTHPQILPTCYPICRDNIGC